MVIALVLTLVVGVQSCAVAVGGGLDGGSDGEDLAAGGAVGVLVAFLYLLGGAFALGLPKVSMILFIIAGVLAFLGAATGFSDLVFWGIVALALAAMSYFGVKEKRRKQAPPPAELTVEP